MPRSDPRECKQERCARRDAWESSKKRTKLHSTRLRRFGVYEHQRICGGIRGFHAQLQSRKDLKFAEVEPIRVSGNPKVVITASGEVQTNEEATVYIQDLDFFRDSTDPRGFASSSLSLGKLCEDHGYSYEWTSGQKPQVFFIAMLENTMEHGRYVPIVVPVFSTGPPSSTLSPSSTSVPQDFTIEDSTPSPAPIRSQSTRSRAR